MFQEYLSSATTNRVSPFYQPPSIPHSPIYRAPAKSLCWLLREHAFIEKQFHIECGRGTASNLSTRGLASYALSTDFAYATLVRTRVLADFEGDTIRRKTSTFYKRPPIARDICPTSEADHLPSSALSFARFSHIGLAAVIAAHLQPQLR